MGRKYKDMYGEYITEGDTLVGSYGIPPRKIEGKVTRSKNIFAFEAEGHNPPICRLKTALECLDLRKKVPNE